MKFTVIIEVETQDVPFPTRNDLVKGIERMVNKHILYDRRDIKKVTLLQVIPDLPADL